MFSDEKGENGFVPTVYSPNALASERLLSGGNDDSTGEFNELPHTLVPIIRSDDAYKFYPQDRSFIPNSENQQNQCCEKSSSGFKLMVIGGAVIILAGLSAFVYSMIYNGQGVPDQRRSYGKFGFNLDPLTSTDWIRGIQLCDYQTQKGEAIYAHQGLVLMQAVIARQLGVIDQLSKISIPGGVTQLENFTTIKTFYTHFSSPQFGRCAVNLAQEIMQYNHRHNASFQLAAGLYLFRSAADGCSNKDECERWSNIQLEAIQLALLNYPVINAVVIGNEDSGELNRVLNYAVQLKDYRTDYQLKFAIMTAQTPSTVKSLLVDKDALTSQLRQVLDVVGVNIYSYWANVDFTQAFHNFAQQFKQFQSLAQQHKIVLSVTETGWPSAGPRGSVDAQYHYFMWAIGESLERLGVPSLFLFQVFDKLVANSQSSNPENHWGLCSHDSGQLLKNSNQTYMSCVVNAKGEQQDKALSKGNSILMVSTNFESEIEVAVCEDESKNTPVCGVVNGVPAVSRAKKNQDLRFYSRALDPYQRVLVLWNLAKSTPPMWCEMAVSALKKQKTLNVCWDEKHNTTQCSTSLAPC